MTLPNKTGSFNFAQGVATLLLGLFCFSAASQTPALSKIELEPVDSVKGPYRPHKDKRWIFVTSKFASNEVLDKKQLDSISNFFISEIVLAYSKYHKVETFDQAGLNRGRWENLLRNYPMFFGNGLTRYGEVYQYGVNTDSAAKKLSHGFYIYFENRCDSLARRTEIREIEAVLEKLGVGKSNPAEESVTAEPEPKTTETEGTIKETVTLKPGKLKKTKFMKPMRAKDPKACRQPFYGNGPEDLNLFFEENIKLTAKQLKSRNRKKLKATVSLRIEFNGGIRYADIGSEDKILIGQINDALHLMLPWNPAVKNGITVKSDVTFTLSCNDNDKMQVSGGVKVANKAFAKCGFTPDEELFDFSVKKNREKIIPEIFDTGDRQIIRGVFERNPGLDSVLIVVDVTGSMGPYIAQALDLITEMLARNSPHISCISFFNDGDNTPVRKRKIGETGGIYILNDDISLDNIGKLLYKAMTNGNGEDTPENNLEAIIKTTGQSGSYKDILIIADNQATPRDMELVDKLPGPVHWIICGISRELNTDYLDLVRMNKGVLHTFRSDVSNLHTLKEGEKVVIDGITYHLGRRGFRLIR